jgi:hypothetical protein
MRGAKNKPGAARRDSDGTEQRNDKPTSWAAGVLGTLGRLFQPEPPIVVTRYVHTKLVLHGYPCCRCGLVLKDGDDVTWVEFSDGSRSEMMHTGCLPTENV